CVFSLCGDALLVVLILFLVPRPATYDVCTLSLHDALPIFNMVEAGAKEVSEETMLEGILFGHKEIQRLVEFQEAIIDEIQPEKSPYEPVEVEQSLEEDVIQKAEALDLNGAIRTEEKQQRDINITAVKDEVLAHFTNEEDPDNEEVLKDVSKILDTLVKDEVRRLITEDKVRPDGRKPEEIRPLASEVGLLPRAHGSGLFTRGQT